MQLNQLKRKTPNKKAKTVGRGGKRGKTAGRGTKGQKARAGHRIRPEVRDVIKKLPKLRGYRNTSIQSTVAVVNVNALERLFSAGDTVTARDLAARGLVRSRKGRTPTVKILGTGDITKKLTLSGLTVSESARKKIEAAGGSVA
jgi:large subunit ribosomal protein L15